MRTNSRWLLCLAAAGLIAPGALAGVLTLPADGVVVDNSKWWNIPHVYADDGLYAIDTMMSNWGQHKFRVSLADPDPGATQNTVITSVVLYVKARAHYSKSTESVCPFFNGQAGVYSAPIKMGTVEITNFYNVTAQETLLADDHWDWDDVTSLSVEYAPRKQGVIYYVNYIYAIVTYRDTLQLPEGHWFEFDPIASPETLAVPFPVTITARDMGGSLLAGYNESALLTDLTGTVSPNVVSFRNGVCNANVAVYDVSAANALTVSDGDTFGVSNSFEVANPGLHHFEFGEIASPQTQNIAFPVTIAACDFFGDTVTAFTGTASLWDLTGSLSQTATGAFAAGTWSGPLSVGATSSWDSLFGSYTDARGTYTGASNGFEVQPPSGTSGGPTQATPDVKAFNVRVSPNPVRGRAELELRMPREGWVKASVFNILGQEVMSRDFGALPAGVRSITWHFEQNLNPGVYFFTISLDGDTKAVRKISAVR